MKAFDCEAFAHINKELEAKDKKCIFIGYGVGDFIYWILKIARSLVAKMYVHWIWS